jgi:RimJ/RimL family protein N-acetyltransferase
MIETERLLLRPWRDEDAELFAALNADPAVMEHFPAPYTREQSDATVARIRDHFARHGFGLWAVEVKVGAPFIGFTGLSRPSFMDVVEVGWRFAHAQWGHGYATEAARAAVAWGFANLELDEIVSLVVPANVRSQRVMAKLGMRRDPDADFEHPSIPAGHRLRAHWLFRLARPAQSSQT